MKFSVTFPSVMYREGSDGVARLIRAIEAAGFDELNVLDHVVMGYARAGRAKPIYPPQMPLLEALVLLAHAAALTHRIGLATSVLVLPQRQPALAAKQLSALDVLSGGRLRVGVGSGWQASEYEALGTPYANRGRRLDEAVGLLRACWGQSRIDFQGDFYTVSSMAMEPKPLRRDPIPIWLGGTVPAALERVAELGDGWMGMNFGFSVEKARRSAQIIHAHAERIGRDPQSIGLQMSLSPARREDPRVYHAHPQRMAEQALALRDLGYDWASINLVELFRAGYRSVNAMAEQLQVIHAQLSAADLLEPPADAPTEVV